MKKKIPILLESWNLSSHFQVRGLLTTSCYQHFPRYRGEIKEGLFSENPSLLQSKTVTQNENIDRIIRYISNGKFGIYNILTPLCHKSYYFSFQKLLLWSDNIRNLPHIWASLHDIPEPRSEMGGWRISGMGPRKKPSWSQPWTQ